MKFISALVLCSILISVASAYRILGILPITAKSHFILFESLMKSLANRGHQVDVISHFPQKNPIKNYNDIISFQGLMESPVNNFTIEQVTNSSGDFIKILGDFYGNRICNFMSHEKFQKLVQNPPADPPYDLVIVQTFSANCYFGLGYVFRVPVVAVTSAPEFPWISNFIGNAENLAAFPHVWTDTKENTMSFWKRLSNIYTHIKYVNEFNEITEKYQTEAMRKYLDPSIPNIRDVEKNVALLLTNTHPIINSVKPITSALVQIAGLHIEANEEVLSPELKQWMDESTHGVVYFTLGSMVLIESLPTEQLLETYASFKQISPIRVLMKIADSSKLPTGLPENVKTMSWIPQQPVLAHPNTKVFISHGGLGSTQEALYFGIPTIGIPLFSDQFSNVQSLVIKGMSIKLAFDEISKKSLDSALDAVLSNEKYKNNAVRYSKLFRDNPMSQSEKTVFWIEYVIRNGADILRSPAIEFSMYQLLLLDIYGFILVILILIPSVIILIVKFSLKRFIKELDSSSSKKKKKN